MILIILDIDDTLLDTAKPQAYMKSNSDISKYIYSFQQLSLMAEKKNNFQLAIASFNVDRGYSDIYLWGNALARRILDAIYGSDSKRYVEDSFIQCYMPPRPLLDVEGKNEQIELILAAHKKKHKSAPTNTFFYDDNLNNIYHTKKLQNVKGVWCPRGLVFSNEPKTSKYRLAVREDLLITEDRFIQIFRDNIRRGESNPLFYFIYVIHSPNSSYKEIKTLFGIIKSAMNNPNKKYIVSYSDTCLLEEERVRRSKVPY